MNGQSLTTLVGGVSPPYTWTTYLQNISLHPRRKNDPIFKLLQQICWTLESWDKLSLLRHMGASHYAPICWFRGNGARDPEIPGLERYSADPQHHGGFCVPAKTLANANWQPHLSWRSNARP